MFRFFKICFFCFEQFDPISFSQAITRKWPLHKMGFSACPSVSFYIKMKRNRWKSITSQKTNLKSVQSKVFKKYAQQSSQSTGTRWNQLKDIFCSWSFGQYLCPGSTILLLKSPFTKDHRGTFWCILIHHILSLLRSSTWSDMKSTIGNIVFYQLVPSET